MKNKSIKRINSLGTVGYVFSILLIIGSIAMMVFTAIGTVGAIAVSKEEIHVNINSDISISSSGNILDTLNHFIKVGGIDDLSSLALNDGETVSVEDRDISEITVEKQGNGLLIDAKTNNITFSMKRVIAALVFAFLFCTALTVMLFMLRNLMKSLKNCDTPFTEEIVRNMTRFAVSLAVTLGVNILGSGIWSSMTTGSGYGPTINLGYVLVVSIVCVLISVFKYGAQLQRESDETL